MLRSVIQPVRSLAHSAPFRFGRISTSSKDQKHIFLVYAPDCADQGSFEERLKVREQHLQEALPALKPQADVSMSESIALA